jgi:hypothetical protein
VRIGKAHFINGSLETIRTILARLGHCAFSRLRDSQAIATLVDIDETKMLFSQRCLDGRRIEARTGFGKVLAAALFVAGDLLSEVSSPTWRTEL